MEIDRSCRLFPDLENARHKRSTARAVVSNTAQINATVQQDPLIVSIPEIDPDLMPVPMPKLPKNNGLC